MKKVFCSLIGVYPPTKEDMTMLTKRKIYTFGSSLFCLLMALQAAPAFGYMRFFVDKTVTTAVNNSNIASVAVLSCINADCSIDNTLPERAPRNPLNNRLIIIGQLRAEFDDRFIATPVFRDCVAVGGCQPVSGNGSYYADELRLRPGKSDPYTIEACAGLVRTARENPTKFSLIVYTSYQSMEPVRNMFSFFGRRLIVNAVVEGCELQ